MALPGEAMVAASSAARANHKAARGAELNIAVALSAPRQAPTTERLARIAVAGKAPQSVIRRVRFKPGTWRLLLRRSVDRAAKRAPLRHFRHRRHEVILFHVFDRAELEFPFRKRHTFVDMETSERMQVDPRHIRDAYLAELNGFIDMYRRECGERNIEYVLASTANSYDSMLLEYLARRKAFIR